MWRPFTLSLASHSYENFLKKIGRAESAPLKNRKDQDKSKATSCEILSDEARQRITDFENLKKKVKLQRETRKQQEILKIKQKEIQIKVDREKQKKMKLRRMEDLKRLRAFSSCRPNRVTPSKGVFAMTCVEDCRKLNKGDLMKEMKRINKNYINTLKINWTDNKVGLYKERRGKSSL
jgi:hypothetical protein